jgi:DNA topoisomerase IA
VSAPEFLKTFGVTFAPSLVATISLSWEDCLGRVQGARVPFLNERRDVLETFIFSKMWYLAQILPLPQSVAARATGLAGAFLWGGHGERLA